jgi:hypothetical protein
MPALLTASGTREERAHHSELSLQSLVFRTGTHQRVAEQPISVSLQGTRYVPCFQGLKDQVLAIPVPLYLP